MLITNMKWHIIHDTPYQMKRKSSTFDDLQGQYCNRKCCIGRSASFLAQSTACNKITMCLEGVTKSETCVRKTP